MKNKKINLTITGCLGRMGQQLIKSASKDKRFKINSLTENKLQRKSNRKRNQNTRANTATMVCFTRLG